MDTLIVEGQAAPTRDEPVVLAVTDAPTPAPAHRRVRHLLHGPSGHPVRILLAVAAAAMVAVLVPTIALATGAGRFISPYHAYIATAVWFVLAIAIGKGLRGGSRVRAVRPALMAGSVVVVAIALLHTLGATLGNARALLALVAVTALIGALVRLVGIRLIRPRAVLVASDATQHPSRGIASHALIRIGDPETTAPEDLAAAAVRAVDQTQADVVRVPSSLPAESITEISWALRNHAVPVQVDLLDGTVHHSRVVGSGDADGVSVLLAPPIAGLRSRLIKRTLDIVGSAGLVLMLSPVLIGTALAIRLDDRGPILYRQTRIGKDGEPFEILKFRSMAVDADARLQELLHSQQTEGKPLFKVQNDPRLTRIGAFIRRYSIDELPQLFNVLDGSMSLVGPRPQRDAEVALYNGSDCHRLGVKPGMTGLWQVSGRSNLSWDEARRLDVHYAHNWSIRLDLSILLRTAQAVVGKDGAY